MATKVTLFSICMLNFVVKVTTHAMQGDKAGLYLINDIIYSLFTISFFSLNLLWTMSEFIYQHDLFFNPEKNCCSSPCVLRMPNNDILFIIPVSD